MAGRAPSAVALGLGGAGLLPFMACGLWLLAGPAEQQGWAVRVLVAYAATIVSFLGGIHWGLAFTEPQGPAPARLVWGVLPSLLGGAALLLPPMAGLALLAATLVLCYAVDHRSYPGLGLAAWLPLRRTLSAVAVLSCAVGLAALG